MPEVLASIGTSSRRIGSFASNSAGIIVHTSHMPRQARGHARRAEPPGRLRPERRGQHRVELGSETRLLSLGALVRAEPGVRDLIVLVEPFGDEIVHDVVVGGVL